MKGHIFLIRDCLNTTSPSGPWEGYEARSAASERQWRASASGSTGPARARDRDRCFETTEVSKSGVQSSTSVNRACAVLRDDDEIVLENHKIFPQKIGRLFFIPAMARGRMMSHSHRPKQNLNRSLFSFQSIFFSSKALGSE